MPIIPPSLRNFHLPSFFQQITASVSAIPFIILFAVISFGCGHQDAIDRVVRQTSSSTRFPSGPCNFLRLTPTATPDQLVAAVTNYWDQSGSFPLGRSFKILETRQVQIAGPSMKGLLAKDQSGHFKYMAVLVDTDIGQKVVLFKYEDHEYMDKIPAGWWHRVYDP